MKKSDELAALLKEISSYRQRDKLVFFVGAGVSRLSGYPSWVDLIRSLAEELGYQSGMFSAKGSSRFSSEEFLKIPEMYYNKMGEAAYYEKIRSQLDMKLKPNNIHKRIMRMNPYHLLTTNYDDLLEQTANTFGINYSVINADEKVAGASTQRYILKVHGDFEHDNFVLKESDYLNHETNFKLVDNVMKTIMATNMIIFIGYQLSDYNIKLILNWVQQVQGDSFIKPIFVHVDPEPLDDNSMDYYQKRGLRIITACELCPEGTYYDRYKAVLDAMLHYVERPEDESVEAAMEYLYGKLLPLDEISYLRADDFIRAFADHTIDKTHMIHENETSSVFTKMYQVVDEKDGGSYSGELLEKALYVKNRISKSGISGCYTRDKTYIDQEHFLIQNPSFSSSCQQIEDGLDSYGNSVEGLYKKAYDLSFLGRLEEAYYIYHGLLERCKEECKWFYYFFSQINLRLLSQLIRQMERLTKSLADDLFYEDEKGLFEPELLEDVGLIQAYMDLPAEIKRYSFLNRLSTSNYYAEDIVKLYEENYRIAEDAAEKRVIMVDIAPYDRAEILMHDAINFIYNNRLLYSMFREHNRFVRTTMHTYLAGKSARMKMGGNVEFSLDYQDLLLMIRNFRVEDLEFLTRKVDLSAFSVAKEDREKFEQYVESIIDYHRDHFADGIIGDEINMYILIREELKSMCFLAKYFIKNRKTVEKYINFVANDMPEHDLDYSHKLKHLEHLKDYISEEDEAIIHEIEELLAEKVQFSLERTQEISSVLKNLKWALEEGKAGKLDNQQ